MRDQLIEVAGNRADVFGDAPFVVIENADETFGGVGDVIQRFKRDAIGERRVAKDRDDVLVAALLVPRGTDSKGGGQGGAGMSGAVAIMLALGAQRKSAQAARTANG